MGRRYHKCVQKAKTGGSSDKKGLHALLCVLVPGHALDKIHVLVYLCL